MPQIMVISSLYRIRTAVDSASSYDLVDFDETGDMGH
jgi:hypothetical protein